MPGGSPAAVDREPQILHNRCKRGKKGMNIFEKTTELQAAGVSSCLVTVTEASGGTPARAGFKMLVTESGELFGTVGGGALENRAIEEAKQLLARGESLFLQLDLAKLGMTCGGRVSLFCEYLPAARGFVLFGGGHVGRALTPMLEALGFRVTVFDNREEVAELLRAQSRTVVIEDYQDISAVAGRVRADRCCFIATHGHEHDYRVLKQLLELDVEYRYIGLIGSKNKVLTTLKKARREGLKIPAQLYAPVGLDLGGDTAAEIAVAVAAEVVAVQYGRTAAHMRLPEVTARGLTDGESGG
jgi:xanthine dehydrogenase accessory factor